MRLILSAALALIATISLAEWDNYRPPNDYQRDWAIMTDMVRCDERAADTPRWRACMDAVMRRWRK